MIQIKNIEQVLNDLITICKADLNCFITAINTEKSDGITLLTIPDTAYYKDISEFPNQKVMVDIATDQRLSMDPNQQSKSALEMNVVVSIWFTVGDIGNNNNDYTRGQRYLDALWRMFGNHKQNSTLYGYEMTAILMPKRSLSRVQKMGVGIELSYKFA